MTATPGLPQRRPEELTGRVLVVDDNDANRYVVSSWLRRSGHTVTTLADGESALTHLASLPDADLPDLAVIDVGLPGISGFQVCEEIKAGPRTAGIPVLHMSATLVASEDRTQGLHRGADGYLSEPIDPAELLATVTAVLRYTYARRHAEALTARVTLLNRLTLELYQASGVAGFAACASAGLAELSGGPATLLFLPPQGDDVRAVHRDGPGAPARTTGPGLPVGVLTSLERTALGRQVGAETGTLAAGEWRRLVPDDTSCLLVGTEAEGDPAPGEVGVVLARSKSGRPSVCLAVPAPVLAGAESRELYLQFANACALSLEALRAYNEEHSLALTLQRSFLPARLPQSAETALAVRYQPATAHAEIGGDFYEAIETADGLLLAIGDVAGHSVSAAAVMGEVRHALRAYALLEHDPAVLLDRLDALLTRYQPGLTATVCLVLVEPGAERIRIANAGHIPPLLMEPGGHAAYVHEHDALLGLGLRHRSVVREGLRPGTRLVLMTDGLVEVRGEDLHIGLERLRACAVGAPHGLEEFSEHLLQQFGQDKEDDIALLIADLG